MRRPAGKQKRVKWDSQGKPWQVAIEDNPDPPIKQTKNSMTCLWGRTWGNEITKKDERELSKPEGLASRKCCAHVAEGNKGGSTEGRIKASRKTEEDFVVKESL